MAGVPLPSNIWHTTSGAKAGLNEYMDANWSARSINVNAELEGTTPPISASLMKVVGVW